MMCGSVSDEPAYRDEPASPDRHLPGIGGKRAASAMVVCALLLAFTFALVGCASAQTPTRDSVNEYSWAELSSISAEIAQAPDDEKALAIAVSYHLAASDGTLDGSQAKEIELANGSRTRALIAGFNHDERVGGGKAGITFVFADAVALRPMNNMGIDSDLSERGGVYGGWTASDLRGWLNGDFERELPSDLRAALADVLKTSCVVSQEETYGSDMVDQSTESLVEQSADKLWIPALAELSGVSGETEAASDSPEWTAPLRAEGSQYQLFADCAVVEDKPNAILTRSCPWLDMAPCRWGLRSVEDITFDEVRSNGSVKRREDVSVAGDSLGVVPCFAL